MSMLNSTLDDHIVEADGRYLNDRELYPLQQYVQSFPTRLDTYQRIGDQHEALTLEALRKLGQAYPELLEQHGPRCKYDMTEVLRYMALSILRDDEVFFKEQLMAWLDTILTAHRKHHYCSKAYRYLQEAVENRMPSASSQLIRPYIEIVIQSLEAHA